MLLLRYGHNEKFIALLKFNMIQYETSKSVLWMAKNWQIGLELPSNREKPTAPSLLTHTSPKSLQYYISIKANIPVNSQRVSK